LNSLSELTDALESQLSQFDETTKQIVTMTSALESLERDAEKIRANDDNLDLAARAKKLAALTDQMNVLKPDLEAHQAAAIQQKKAIVLASADLRSRCFGEAAGRAQTRSREVVDELGRDFDLKKILFPPAQIAEAHRSVQELRGVERALSLSGTTDEDRLAFARRVRTDFLGKLT
jgi:hypothetical protein